MGAEWAWGGPLSPDVAAVAPGRAQSDGSRGLTGCCCRWVVGKACRGDNQGGPSGLPHPVLSPRCPQGWPCPLMPLLTMRRGGAGLGLAAPSLCGHPQPSWPASPPAPSALSPPEVPLGPLLNIQEESLGPFGKKSELPSLPSSLIASVGRVLWAGLLTALGERLEGQRQRLPWGRDAAARRVQESLC